MANLYLGIDVGGTKIKGVLWDGRSIRRRATFATPVNRKGFVKQLQILLHTLDPRGVVRKVGIGVAGAVDGVTVKSARNIPYLKNFDFRKEIANRRMVKVDNDARCFARAEYIKGAAHGTRNVLFVTIGTGIGRALGRRGKILKIKRFEHAEPWERKYQKFRKKSISELTSFLAQHLAPLIGEFRPETVVLGGGGVTSGAVRLDTVHEAARRYTELSVLRKTAIVKGELGEAAGAIGAALLFSRQT